MMKNKSILKRSKIYELDINHIANEFALWAVIRGIHIKNDIYMDDPKMVRKWTHGYALTIAEKKCLTYK